jgi:hypothetical protein
MDRVEGVPAWSVFVEAVAPEDAENADVSNHVEKLEAQLLDQGVSVTYDDRRYGAQFFVDAADAGEALGSAQESFSQAAEVAQLPEWPVARAAVLTSSEFVREIVEPASPVYLGIAELAERLHVSRQRASQIAKSQQFPPPVARLRSGPIWVEPAVERFIARWIRQPGPKQQSPARSAVDEARFVGVELFEILRQRFLETVVRKRGDRDAMEDSDERRQAPASEAAVPRDATGPVPQTAPEQKRGPQAPAQE